MFIIFKLSATVTMPANTRNTSPGVFVNRAKTRLAGHDKAIIRKVQR